MGFRAKRKAENQQEEKVHDGSGFTSITDRGIVQRQPLHRIPSATLHCTFLAKRHA